MDDLVRDGLAMILAAAAAAVLVACGIALLALRLLQAWASGDTEFLATAAAALVLLSSAYLGTGLWLHRTGRI